MEAPAITGSTKLGIDDFLRARWNRGTLYVFAIALLFVIAIDIYLTRPLFALTPDALETWTPIGWSVAAVIGLWTVLITLVSVAYGLRLSGAQRTVTYGFGPEAVSARDGTGTASTIPWSIVRRITESGRAFRLTLRPMRVVYIPKRAFAAADIAPLRALFRDKLAKRAALKAG
jgi:YcxB-like protein